MSGWFSKKPRGVRLTALVVTSAFLYAEAVQAQGLPQFSPTKIQPPVSQSFLNPLENFELPPEIGQLQEIYLNGKEEVSAGEPFVIHIQDSHANFQAQQNIVKILERLFDGSGLNGNAGKALICLEGARGALETGWARRWSDRRARDAAAGLFLERGKMTAGEYFGVTAGEEVALRGVEDGELYEENLRCYDRVRELAERAQPRLDEMRGKLQARRQAELPKLYLELEEETRKLYDGKIEMLEYLNFLQLEFGVDWAASPQLDQMRQALELQKTIEMKALEKERAELVKKLERKLAKEDLARLIKATLEFRVGKIESLEFYAELLESAERAGLEGQCREIEKMARFLEMQKEISAQEAMAELEGLRAKIRNELLVTPQQRELAREWDWLELAQNMARLEVTREQLEAYRKDKAEILSWAVDFVEARHAMPLQDDISYAGINIGAVRDILKAAEKFYSIAQKRDEALVENTLQALKAEKKEIAILITGGFHTQGLTARLKEIGSSHAVIAPRLTEAPNEKLYQSLMQAELSPLQRFLSSTGNRLATPSYLFVQEFLARSDELRRRMEGMRVADQRLLELLYWGYRTSQLHQEGRGVAQIEAALDAEARDKWRSGVSVRLTAKGPIAYAEPTGGPVVAVLVSRDEPVRGAMESYHKDGLWFSVGDAATLQKQAETPTTWVESRKQAQLIVKDKRGEETIDVAEAGGHIAGFLEDTQNLLKAEIRSQDPKTLQSARHLIGQIDWEMVAQGLGGDSSALEAAKERAADLQEKILAAEETPLPKEPKLSLVSVGAAARGWIQMLIIFSMVPFVLGALGGGALMAGGYYSVLAGIAALSVARATLEQHRKRQARIAATPRGMAAREAADLLAFVALCYKKAEKKLEVLETPDFLISYQAASDAGKLDDPEQLQKLLALVEPARLEEIRGTFPWLEIEVKFPLGVDSNNIKNNIQEVQEYLRYVKFLHELQRVRENDIEEAEAKIDKAVDKALQEKITQFLIEKVVGDPKENGRRLITISRLEGVLLEAMKARRAQLAEAQFFKKGAPGLEEEILEAELFRILSAYARQSETPFIVNLNNPREVKKLRPALREFAAQFIQTSNEARAKERDAMLADAAAPHPFWGPELPYEADEAVFTLRFGEVKIEGKSKKGKRKAKAAAEKGFNISLDHSIVVDLTNVNAEDFAAQFKGKVREYVRSKQAKVKRAHNEVKGLVDRYEAAIRSGDRAERSKVAAQLQRVVVENKKDQQFYRRLVSEELENRAWGFWRDLRELFYGIYRYGHGGEVGAALGKLFSTVMLVAIAFAVLAGVGATVAQAQDSGGTQPGDSPQAGPGAGDRPTPQAVPPEADSPRRGPDLGTPPERGPPQPDEAARRAEQERIERIAAQVRARHTEELTRNVPGLDTGYRYRQDALEAFRAQNNGRVQLRNSLDRTQNEFFAIGVDFSEREITLGLPDAVLGPPEVLHVPTDSFGAIVESFATYDQFQDWFYLNRANIHIYDFEGNEVTNITNLTELVEAGWAFDIWLGDKANKDIIENGRPLAIKLEFGMKARLDTATVARMMQQEIGRKADLWRALSTSGGPVAQFVYMDAARRFQNAPEIHIPGVGNVSSAVRTFRDLALFPRENFRFYEWPIEQADQRAGRILQGRRLDVFDLIQKEKNNEAYQTWYYDPATGNEYFLFTGTNAITAHIADTEAFRAQMQFEFRVMDVLSRDVDPASVGDYLRGGRSDVARGTVMFEMAEVAVGDDGMTPGPNDPRYHAPQFHPFEDLQAETTPRAGTDFFDFRTDGRGFPQLRLKVRNERGEIERVQVARGGQTVTVDRELPVGFFLRQPGGRLLRLHANEVNTNAGRYEIRVIERENSDGSPIYTEAQLGNKLMYGRNVIRHAIAENRAGAFRILVDVMDAEHNLDSLYGDLIVSTVAAAFNVTLFIDPSGSGAFINRAIPLGVRALYQIFMQSRYKPTDIPIVNVDSVGDETPERQEARIREEARAILNDLIAKSDNNIVQDTFHALFWTGMQSGDARQILDFVNAAAMAVFEKRRVEDVTEEEKLVVIVKLFHTDWHLEREVTAQIDFFTSLVLNIVLLSDFKDHQTFRLARLRPDGSEGAFGEFERETTTHSRIIQRFFSGDIGGGAVMPAPTTAGAVQLTSFARVFREVSGTRGAMETWPFPLGVGPSLASIIKTISFGFFFSEAPWVWEPEAIVVSLFGFPTQIFGSIARTSEYIDGRRGYAVVADMDRLRGPGDWLIRFARTFTGGGLSAVTDPAEYRRLRDQQLQLIGYAQIPLPKVNPDDETEAVRYQLAPVYGVMEPDGIHKVVIFGLLAAQDQLERQQRDLANYDRYQQLRRTGGVIVEVGAGRSYHFTSAGLAPGHVINPLEMGVFYQTHQNPTTHLIQSYFPNRSVSEQAASRTRNQGETFDQAWQALALGAMADHDSLNLSARFLTGGPQGHPELLRARSVDEAPLFGNTINVANGNLVNPTTHIGPSAIVGHLLIQRMFQLNPSAYLEWHRSYVENERAAIEELQTAGNWWNYQHHFATGISGLDEAVLEQCEIIAQALMARIDEPTGGLIQGEYEEDGRRYFVLSTEENLAAYSFFLRLHQITNSGVFSSPYLEAAQKVLGFLTRVQDRENYRFYAGMKIDVTAPADSPYRADLSREIATDVNALAISALGIEVMEYMRDDDGHFLFGPDRGTPGSRHVAAHCLARLYQRPDLAAGLNAGQLREAQRLSGTWVNVNGVCGFDATNAEGREEIRRQEGSASARPEAIFPEQTAYVALAHLQIADFYENVLHDSDYAAQHRASARLILQELSKLGVRSDAGGAGLPYATTPGILRYSFDGWRVPNASVSVAANAAYIMASQGYNPYALNGRSWFQSAEAPRHVYSTYLYRNFPQIPAVHPQIPLEVSMPNGMGQSFDVELGRSVSLPNPAGLTDPNAPAPGNHYRLMLEAFNKIQAWEALPPAEQTRLASDATRCPTAEERARVAGLQLEAYNQDTNSFSYFNTQTGLRFNIVMIPGDMDFDRTLEKLRAAQERAGLEARVIEEGAVRFLDPQTRRPINAAGQPISGRDLPLLRFGTQEIRQFLRDHLAGRPVVQQHEAIMRGMFTTTIQLTVNGQQVPREVIAVIEHGRLGAEENLRARANDDSDTALQVIRDLYRMHSESGVIVTSNDPARRGTFVRRVVGDEEVMRILRRIQTIEDPNKRASLDLRRYVNLNFGDGNLYTLVFGDALAEERGIELDRQLTEIRLYRQRLQIAIENARRGPPYFHPEWMNEVTILGRDPATNGVILNFRNIFNGRSRIEIHADGRVIQIDDPIENRLTRYHPDIGVRAPWYTVATQGTTPDTIIVPVGIDEDGKVRTAAMTNITETYDYFEDSETGVSTVVTFHWEDGTVEKVETDAEGDVLNRVRGTFNRGGVDRTKPFNPETARVVYTEWEEMTPADFSIDYTLDGETHTFRGRRVTGSVIYIGIDPATGERIATSQVKARGVVVETRVDGSQVVELTDERTGAKKRMTIDSAGHVTEERSRAQIVYYEYDAVTRINRPLKAVDRFNGLTLITFSGSARDAATGNITSTGTNAGGVAVVEVRDREGNLLTLQIGAELTTYRVGPVQEVPIHTVDVTTGEIIKTYNFEFDAASKQIRIITYDWRTHGAERHIWHGPTDRLMRILSGSFQDDGGTVTYDSRTEVAYAADGREESRTTYIEVNSTTGGGGRPFERSTVTATADNGVKTLQVTNLFTNKVFARLIDSLGHLVEERDGATEREQYTAVIYRFDSSFGTSIPVYKRDLTGSRGNVSNGIDHVLSNFEVTPDGNNIRITETFTTPPPAEGQPPIVPHTAVEIRDRRMRLLEKPYLDGSTIHYDGSLEERPVRRTRQLSGEPQPVEVSTFQLEYRPAEGISRVTEIEQINPRYRSQPLQIDDWDRYGRNVRREIKYYAVLPTALGQYPLIETRTTVNEFDTRNPFLIIHAVTTTDNSQYRQSHPDGVLTETRVVGTEGTRTTVEVTDHLTGLTRRLIYDSLAGFDFPVEERQGNFTVEHREGDRVFSLVNQGWSQFVSGRWVTIPLEPASRAARISSGYAWFRINLGLTYSAALPGKPPYRITPNDVSSYDTLSFWIQGNQGGEHFSLTLTDESGSLNQPTLTLTQDDLQSMEINGKKINAAVTQEWRQICIPLSELQRRGLKLNQLIQLGVRYGNDLGNARGAEIRIARLMFEGGPAGTPSRPVLEVSGEMSALGDVKLVDPSLTGGTAVPDFFTDETLPSSISGAGGSGFSFMRDQKGAVVGTTDYLYLDPAGNIHSRVWRFQGEDQINSIEVRRPFGQLLYRIEVHTETIGSYRNPWRERVCCDTFENPLFSVDEENGQLHHLYQTLREPNGAVVLFEYDAQKKEERVFRFRADGTSSELYAWQILPKPEPDWAVYQQRYASQISELSSHWDQYHQGKEFVVKREEPYNKVVAGLAALIATAVAFLTAMIFKIRNWRMDGGRIFGPKAPPAAPAVNTLDTLDQPDPRYGPDDVRAYLENLLKSLGWNDTQILDLASFLDGAVREWVRTNEALDAGKAIYAPPGLASPENYYVMIPVHTKEAFTNKFQYEAISLERYLLKGVIGRLCAHLAANEFFIDNMADKAFQMLSEDDGKDPADQTASTYRRKLLAYKEVSFAIITVQKKQYRAQGGTEIRRRVFKNEDLIAFFDYLNHGQITQPDQVDLELTLDQIEGLANRLIAKGVPNVNEVNEYVALLQEKLAPCDEAVDIEARNTPAPSGRWENLITRVAPFKWLTHLVQFSRDILKTFKSISARGDAAIPGILYWGAVIALWLFWNILIGQVWISGVWPYWEMLYFGSSCLDIFLGFGFLAIAGIPAFFFMILSFFSVGWALGGALSVVVMEWRGQAAIKADRPFFIPQTVPQAILMVGLVGMMAASFVFYFWPTAIVVGSIAAIALIFTALRIWRHRRITAPTLNDLPLEIYRRYQRPDPKLLPMERIEFQYRDLLRDLQESYKLTEEEYQILQLRNGENLKQMEQRVRSEKINWATIANKEARDRLKFWANNLLRSDPLPPEPEWEELKSLTMVAPTVDPFRHDWYALNWIEPSTGLTRLYAVKQGYPAEFENLLKRLDQRLNELETADTSRAEDVKTAERLEASALINQLAQLSRGASLRDPTGRYAKKLVRIVEDFANERFQMVETTLKGFLNVKQAYREAAQREVARRYNKTIETLNEGELELAEQLLNEKLQLVWNGAGKPPVGRKNNNKGMFWDSVQHMWKTLEAKLIEQGQATLAQNIKAVWEREKMINSDGSAGPEFKDPEVVAEATELKLRRLWNDVLAQLPTQLDRDELIEEITTTQLGHALVHNINITFVNRMFAAGSPKASDLQAGMPYIRGELMMLFDGDTEIRLEDARKLVQLSGRFNDEADLGLIQFRQYIFNNANTAQTKLAEEPLGGFWGANLRMKSLIGQTGFYGHNGIMRTEFVRHMEGIQPDHISEDILVTIAMRIYGAKTGYDDRLQFGEGQETTQAQYATPTGKWSQGSARSELQGSRVFLRFMNDPNIPFAEKIDIRFNLGFYDMVHYFSVPGLIAFVVGSLFLGMNAFAILAAAFILAGIGMSQAIGLYTLSQYWERRGYVQGTLAWFSFLFLEGGFFYWTTLIASQSEGFLKGLYEEGKWVTSAKDQGILSEPWQKILAIFNLGFRISLPMLVLVALTPWSYWFLTLPVAGIVVAGAWALAKAITGKEVPFWPFLLTLWSLPLLYSAILPGGGLLISGLFYIAVLVSFLISPIIFNPNALRLHIDLTTVLSYFESPEIQTDPASMPVSLRKQVGVAFSRHPQLNKIERIEELLRELKVELQEYRRLQETAAPQADIDKSFKAIKDGIWSRLSNEEKEVLWPANGDLGNRHEASLDQMATYLIWVERYLLLYHSWETYLTDKEKADLVEIEAKKGGANWILKDALEKYINFLKGSGDIGILKTALTDPRKQKVKEDVAKALKGEISLAEIPTYREKDAARALWHLTGLILRSSIFVDLGLAIKNGVKSLINRMVAKIKRTPPPPATGGATATAPPPGPITPPTTPVGTPGALPATSAPPSTPTQPASAAQAPTPPAPASAPAAAQPAASVPTPAAPTPASLTPAPGPVAEAEATTPAAEGAATSAEPEAEETVEVQVIRTPEGAEAFVLLDGSIMIPEGIDEGTVFVETGEEGEDEGEEVDADLGDVSLTPEAPEENQLLDSINNLIRKLNEEIETGETEESEEKPFAPHKGVRLEAEKIEEGMNLSLSQIQVVIADDQIAFKPTGPLTPEAEAWLDLNRRAIAFIQNTVARNPELQARWTEILSREDNRAPPVLIQVSSALDDKLNSVRQILSRGGRPAQVNLIFSEQFVRTLLNLNASNPEIVPILLAERLFHELGHTNAPKSYDQLRIEEAELIRLDLEFNKQVAQGVTTQNEPLPKKITDFFEANRSKILFQSGYYFWFLQALSSLATPAEVDHEISVFIDRNLDVTQEPFLVEAPATSETPPTVQPPAAPANAAQSILRKLFDAVRGSADRFNQLFGQIPLPVEAGANPIAIIQSLIEREDAEGLRAELLATLIEANTFNEERYRQIVGENAATDEEKALLLHLQAQHAAQQAAANEQTTALVQTLRRQLITIAAKPVPELVVLDSSLLKKLGDDKAVLNVLHSYRNQVAIVVMKEDENAPLFTALAKEFNLVYESKNQQGSLEESILVDVNSKIQESKSRFSGATIITVEDHSAKWQWLANFRYHVLIHRGIVNWQELFAAPTDALRNLLNTLHIPLEELRQMREPQATPQEFRLRDNVVLISA